MTNVTVVDDKNFTKVIDNDTGKSITAISSAEIAKRDERLAQIKEQVIDKATTVSEEIVQLGQLLEEAHDILTYKDGGWKAYVADLGFSEWTANRLRAMYTLRSPDHLGLPNLAGMIEGKEATWFVHGKASNGSAALCKGIDKAIGKGQKRFKNKVLPTVAMNATEAKEFLKQFEAPKDDPADEPKETSEDTASDTGATDQLDVTGMAKLVEDAEFDFDLIEQFIRDDAGDDPMTSAVINHMRNCWQVFANISEGKAPEIIGKLMKV